MDSHLKSDCTDTDQPNPNLCNTDRPWLDWAFSFCTDIFGKIITVHSTPNENGRYSYIWQINNYSSLKEHPIWRMMRSPAIIVNNNIEVSWRLMLKRNEEKNIKNLLFSIHAIEKKLSKNRAYNLKFFVAGGKSLTLFPDCMVPEGNLLFSVGEIKTIPNDSAVTLTNNTMLFTFEMAFDFSDDTKNIKLYNYLLESRMSGDVQFIIENKKLHALKSMLTPISPVFAEMLEKETAVPAIINIDDVSYLVFKELIRFVATRKVYNIKIVSENLLKAAYKYKIEELKNFCSDYLCQEMTYRNAENYFKLADLCGDEKLKNEAMNFIVALSFCVDQID